MSSEHLPYIPRHAAQEPATPLVSRPILRGGALLATAGMSLAFAAGCEGGQAAGKPVFVDPQGVETAVSRNVAFSQFNNALASSSPDISKAGTLVPDIAQGNEAVRTPLQRAVTAAVAQGILSDASSRRSDSPTFSTATSFNAITNPAVRRDTQSVTYILDAEAAIDRTTLYAATDTYTPDQARKDITEHMPAGANKYRNDALQAVSLGEAQNIVTQDWNNDDEAAGRAAVKRLADPYVRVLAEKAIDADDADTIVEKLSYDGISVADAKADASNITDPRARKLVRQAIKAYEQGGELAVSDIDVTLSEAKNDAQEALNPDTSAFSDDLTKADQYESELTIMKSNAEDDAEAALGKEFAAHSRLHPQAAEAVKPLRDPDELVDLTDLKGKTTIHNSYKDVAPATDKDKEADTYQTFGDVHVEDGKLVMNLQEGGGMNAKIAAQMREAFDQVRPLLEAAFASGELLTVHFVIGDTFDPAYSPATRETYLTLKQDDTMTMDRLVTSWRHETLHALSRNVMNNMDVSKGQVARMAVACNNMKATLYDDFRYQLLNSPKLLPALRRAADPKMAPVIDKLSKAVANGKLKDLLKRPAGDLSSNDMVVNECMSVDDAAQIIINLTAELGIDDDTARDSLFTTPEFTTFNKLWKTNADFAAVYDQIINESVYVTSSDIEALDLGHAEDDDREMFASLMDAALNWPDKLKQHLNEASPEDRKAVLDMLSICTDLLAKHPSLKPYVTRIRSTFLTPSNKGITDPSAIDLSRSGN